MGSDYGGGSGQNVLCSWRTGSDAVSEERAVRYTLTGVVQLLVAIPAVGGGAALIADPSGGLMGLSLDLLEGSPLGDYLISGLFLLVIVGLGHFMGAWLVFRGHPLGGPGAVVLGVILVTWIVIQVAWIGLSIWLQPLYLAVGIAETVLGMRIS